MYCNRGLKQHVRQVHDLKKYPEYFNPVEIECDKCSKLFKSKDALFQHSINKHTHQPIELELKAMILDTNTEKPLNNVNICKLCGWAQTDGKTCLERLIPPGSDELECSCGKVVINSRALVQHYKFCILKNKAKSN
jgi:hypothetical protein